jgi:hypothetical protein
MENVFGEARRTGKKLVCLFVGHQEKTKKS